MNLVLKFQQNKKSVRVKNNKIKFLIRIKKEKMLRKKIETKKKLLKRFYKEIKVRLKGLQI